jgi:hypothetical protein
MTTSTGGEIWSGKAVSLKSWGVSARDVSTKLQDLDAQFLHWRPGMPWPSISFVEDFSIVSSTQALRWGAYNMSPEYDRMGKPNLRNSQWSIAGLVCEGNHRNVSADPHMKQQFCTHCQYPNMPGEHNASAVYLDGSVWRTQV